MKRIAAIACAALVALFATACNNQSAKMHDEAVQAVTNLETQWNQDYAAKSAEKLVAYYADDAVLMASGMPAASGKDAIKNMLTQMVADPALSLKFHASKVDAAQAGDLVYTRGTYEMTMTDPATKKVMNDHGSYVTVYHKQGDGTYKAVSDIATSEVPPPAPAAAPMKMKH